jgi:hypothetical protein
MSTMPSSQATKMLQNFAHRSVCAAMVPLDSYLQQAAMEILVHIHPLVLRTMLWRLPIAGLILRSQGHSCVGRRVVSSIVYPASVL